IEEPRRKMKTMNRVYRIFLRSSATRHAFLMVSSTLDHLGLSACLLDLLLFGSRECRSLYGQALGQLAAAKDLDAVQRLRDDTGLEQQLGGDLRAVVKALQRGNVDRRVGGAEDVVEAALGQATCQRHLAALKARANAAARAGPLALVAAACGLAVTGTSATTLAVCLLGRAQS